MPTVSKKQERFMQAVAHSPAFAKKVGVPTKVGKEFTKSGGGMAESKKIIGKEVAFMKKKGAPKSMIKHEESEMKAMKKSSNVKKMAMGGRSLPPNPRRPLAQATDMPRPRPLPLRTGKMAAGGTPNDYIKGAMGNATAPSTGGGGRRPLAQAIDRPRPVRRDKDYGNGMNPFFQDIKSQGVSASAPRRPLAQAINKPGMGGMPPRDIGTGAGPRRPLPQAINKPGMMKKGGVVASKMGSVRTASPSRDGVASKGKTKGTMVKMGGVRAAVKGGKC